MVKKKFIYKIYDTTNTFVKVLNDVLNKPVFTYSINGGLGELKLKLDRKLDDYGEGTDLDFNYRIKIYVNDDTNDNILIYTGYIVAFRPSLTGGREAVEIVFLPNISKLENDYFRAGTSVEINFTIPKSAVTIEQVMKDIIDNYRGLSSNHLISNDYGSVSGTGKNITKEYRNIRHLEAIRQTAEFLDYDWYWYIDVSGKLHLRQRSATANHSLFLNKQVKRVMASKDIETTRNHYFLWNVSEKTSYDNNYSDATSINAFDRISELVSDGDIASDAMANYLGGAKLAGNKNSKRKIEIEVTDESANIESFKPGDTIKIMNIDTGQTIFGSNMMITRIIFDYGLDRATLELEETSSDFADMAGEDTVKETTTATIEEIVKKANTGLNTNGYVQREIRGSILPSYNPGAAGLYYTNDYIGFHDSSNWTVYIKNDGKFYFKGDANNYIQWDGATLDIQGSLSVGNIGGGWIISGTNGGLIQSYNNIIELQAGDVGNAPHIQAKSTISANTYVQMTAESDIPRIDLYRNESGSPILRATLREDYLLFRSADNVDMAKIKAADSWAVHTLEMYADDIECFDWAGTDHSTVMMGAIKLITTAGGNSEAWLYFDADTDGKLMIENLRNEIVLYPGEATGTKAVLPGANDAIEFGSSSFAWKNVIAITVDQIGVNGRIRQYLQGLRSRAAPGNPAAGEAYVYLDSADGDIKAKNSAGNVVVIANFP